MFRSVSPWPGGLVGNRRSKSPASRADAYSLIYERPKTVQGAGRMGEDHTLA